ncbi:hypothetical protein [Salinisphaera sp. G21_0]|uniref:hypothetical protein n=1 Tax=Salinisphaera sp. G21_0 TaxID=2821094 RepID=UPI001ADA51CC|nr:hypothetical protein [Salinisphaera sp. G21_0]MBO9480692.1 hypothetical protein [Salinisphaera sp. G21_0]
MDSHIAQNMLNSQSLRLTAPYLQHESGVLQNLIISDTKINNMVVVGSGPLTFRNLAISHDIGYYAVDPFYRVNSDANVINFINLHFESITRSQITKENVIFVFWFNVAFYIKDFSESVRRIVRKGDILFISSWGNGIQSKALLKKYLKSVYQTRDEGTIEIMVDNILKFRPVESLADWLCEKKCKIDQYSNAFNDINIIFTDYVSQFESTGVNAK